MEVLIFAWGKVAWDPRSTLPLWSGSKHGSSIDGGDAGTPRFCKSGDLIQSRILDQALTVQGLPSGPQLSYAASTAKSHHETGLITIVFRQFISQLSVVVQDIRPVEDFLCLFYPFNHVLRADYIADTMIVVPR